DLTNIDGVLYFTANYSNGRELFRISGPGVAVERLGDLYSNVRSDPFHLLDVSGTLIFTSEYSPSRLGNSIWKVDTATGEYTHLGDIDDTDEVAFGKVAL